MGPVSFSSMLANGCRSFSAPTALVRTLALTHVALSEHSNSYMHVKVAWFSRSSNKRKSARQSLKQDVSQPTAISSANGYLKFSDFDAFLFVFDFGFLRFWLNCWYLFVGRERSNEGRTWKPFVW
ncbi:hypothetical protein ACFX2I_005214 [Malus domestica]